jgi:Rps23 Pro-64 3,4-dihydroxylase Tpa1-like proline 4-hydroxylase
MLQRLQNLITPAVAQSLVTKGYAVIDSALGRSTTSSLRREIQALRSCSHPNSTHFVKGSHHSLLAKHSIIEAELLEPQTQQLAPLAASLQHDPTLRIMLSLFLPSLKLDSQAIKFQINSGSGGCFPIHQDADSNIATDGRKITAIFYLNNQWSPHHGGQLKLYPWPNDDPVVIDPIDDRLVLFTSTTMLHRVLPYHQYNATNCIDRYCFTIWLSEDWQRKRAVLSLLDSDSTNNTAAVDKSGGGNKDGKKVMVLEAIKNKLHDDSNISDDDDVIDQDLMHQVRLLVARWMLKEEWESSLMESHPGGEARDVMMDEWREETKAIERVLSKSLGLTSDINEDKLRVVFHVNQWL